MLRNQFIIAFRNLIRNPVYSVINVGGLSIGIAACLLILLWVSNELSYDRFLPNLDRICMVRDNVHTGKEVETWGGVPGFIYDQLKARKSEIRHVSMISDRHTEMLAVGSKGLNRACFYVNEDFLEIFPFELVAGSREKILSDISSIVITQSTAKALFGDQDPINQVVSLHDQYELKVTGVLRDFPNNSSFDIDALMSFDLLRKMSPEVDECVNQPDCSWIAMYAELQPGIDINEENVRIKDLIRKQTTWLDKELFLYPFSRFHLHGNFRNGAEGGTDQSDFVQSFSAVALSILLVACINFMNLSTARSERRAREIGIRKLSGSQRRDLILQFLRESTFVAAIAFVIAVVIVELTLPFYNYLLQEHLSIDYASPYFWGAGLLIICFTGLIAGSYPAFFLSSFRPANVLKGALHTDRGSVTPRKMLVITQFGFSILLIVGAVAVHQQIEFMRKRELGYDNHNLVTVPSHKGIADTYRAIKQELISTGLVVSACKTNSPITEVYEQNFFSWPGYSGPELPIDNIFAEYDYAKTMGIKVEGRDFLENVKTDKDAILLNRTAAKMLGTKKPIGSTVLIGTQPFTLIGILDDVLMDDPHGKVNPLYVLLELDWKTQMSTQNITLRLAETDDVPAAMKKIESVFKKYSPLYPFEYSFVNADYDRKFRRLNMISQLTNSAALVAILIACLGLFGLAAFTAERRTKEFGVRKVLGAGWTDLVTLISRDFVRMIAIAFVVASPIAWWLVNNFLEEYAYRISFDWLILPVVGAAVLLLSLLVVGSQAVRVAATNPVDSLRSE